MRSSRLRITLAPIVFSLAACAIAPAPKSIADSTAADPRLTVLTRLLNDADMTQTLQGPGPYTLFAPTDEAFKALPPATLDALAKDKTRLKAVLANHLVQQDLGAAEIKNGSVKTVQGGQLALYRAGPFVTVDDAVVVNPDVRATNGSIQIVDKVLLPR